MQVQSLRVPLAADESGTLRVEGKRVTLKQVLSAFEEGATAEEIVAAHAELTLAEVYAVLSFYLQHRREVERYMLEGDRPFCAA
jgi:uncharacterized protein (DUF433 family)